MANSELCFNVKRMVIVLNWIRFFKMRMEMVSFGFRFIDRCKLLIWAFIDSIPKKLTCLRRFVEQGNNRLIQGILVNIHGNKFYNVDLDSLRVLSPKFENWMNQYLCLEKNDVFVDIGSHIGKYTISIAKLIGNNGKVISIEPYPYNFKVLVKNIVLNGLENVLALNVAC